MLLHFQWWILSSSDLTFDCVRELVSVPQLLVKEGTHFNEFEIERKGSLSFSLS